MSMNGSFRSVSPKVIEAVRRDPGLVAALTAPAFAAAPSPGILAIPGMKEHFAAIAQAREQLGKLASPQDVGEVVEIDKAWHGVHFVLTGTVEPDGSVLGEAVLGGEDVGEDLGYGAARVVAPDDVAQIAAALATFDDDALATRFDAAVMAEQGIYPDVWDEDGETIEWIADAVDTLRKAYAEAAAKGHGMLAWLS
jgi:hypothetical protein